MSEKSCLNQTPRELGYRMPAEWSKHEAVWLSWPHDPTTFISGVEKVEETYLQIIELLHRDEYVNLFVKDSDTRRRVTGLFKQRNIDVGRVRFFEFDYADVWFRDYGPIFVKKGNKDLAMVRWVFNSWGEKYDELLKDKEVPEVMNRRMHLKCFKPGIVLEGGSIDVNGKGTLLTTQECLLNKNRNPHLTKEKIEGFLQDYLGVTHIVWLECGIAGDDTDGHVDDIARFLNPTTVVCAYEDGDDENGVALRSNYEILCRSTDQDDRKLRVVKLPMPGNVLWEGKPLPASYTNFYIGNKTVLAPTFESQNDEAALSILRKLFPNRKVVGVDCLDLICGFGAIHCITQQQPKVANKL